MNFASSDIRSHQGERGRLHLVTSGVMETAQQSGTGRIRLQDARAGCHKRVPVSVPAVTGAQLARAIRPQLDLYGRREGFSACSRSSRLYLSRSVSGGSSGSARSIRMDSIASVRRHVTSSIWIQSLAWISLTRSSAVSPSATDSVRSDQALSRNLTITTSPG